MGKRIPFHIIKRKVDKLRADCDIALDIIDIEDSDSVAVDLEHIANRKGIRIVTRSFKENISGMFFKQDGRLFLGVNENHSENRQRFTIAHEIGHYILHTNDPLHCDDKGEVDKVYLRSELQSREETEANYFAADLLMPELLIDKSIDEDINTVDALAEHFKVSEEAMRYRLINLGYL